MSTQCDESSCFGVLPINENILVHGEQVLTAVNNDGEILWQFGGVDIFVHPQDCNIISIKNGIISIIDWQGNNYDLDFNGVRID